MAQNTLEIVAKVKADVSEAQKQFQQLFAQFQNFKLDKNATADITKSFSDLNKAFEKLQIAGENAAGGKTTIEQLKNIGRASQDVDKAIANLNHSLNKVGDKNFIIDMNTPELVKARQDIEGLSQVLSNKYTRAVEQAKEAQATLADSGYTKSISGYSDLVNALGTQDLEKAQENFKKLQNNIDIASNSIAGSIKNLQQKIADAVSGKESQKTSLEGFRDKIKQELNAVKADLDGFSSSLTSQANKNDIFSSLIGKIGDNKNLKLFKAQLEAVKTTLTNFTPKDAGKLKEQLATVWDTYQNTARPENISAQAWSGFGRAFKARMGEDGAFQDLINSGTIAQQKVDELKTKLSTFGQEAANLGIENPFNKLIEGLTAGNLDISKFDEQITKKIQKLNADITKAQTEGSNVQNIEKLTKQAEALKAFKAAIDEAFGSSVQSQIQGTNEKLGEAANRLQQGQQEQVQGAAASYRDFANAMGEAGQQARSLNGNLQGTTDAIVRQKEELSQVVSRFAQFGTMAGILRTFGRVVRSAFASVKELDEAMNSIAVVTDYTTKDLWNQIDAYTAMAQATGSTIKGSYEVAQLYYQQGLTDAEVMTAANETLKMARISNIEYSKATDYATAAIKGFGLAYQDLAHVNDVYSNLAAKTAADTREISIAMGKVASIAHSTGMELETTAAFLTQIIATTREAPETAGTALKTVIARFAEVKKLISQGEATGTDEEGTEVSVNKIEEALKTAGVALRDTTGQMRDLDDVFIELASRWDSLDTLQQRYIATQAAGSRQQSRFLAMMNDYEGLQETLGYAMDSAGASQEQFNKTLDSLQSKLNNLSNAWTEFTTGILNQDVIKFGVDALTQILNLINDITGALGAGGNTISKVLLTFGALRYGTGAAGTALSALGISNNLPNLKDQWASGGIGEIIKAISMSQQGYIPMKDVAKLNQIVSLQNNIEAMKKAMSGLDPATEAAKAFATQITVAEASITSLSGSMKGLSSSFWGALGPMGKITLVITAIIAVVTILDKVIKTSKEKIQEYNETIKELQNLSQEINSLEDTLSNLRSYQEGMKDSSGKTIDGMDDFATLQKGVGSYGQNISLTNEQYSRYLEICDAIVALNPDIAKGYGSNAEAIAREKDALEQLIATQEKDLHVKALQIATGMDTKFYEDAKAKAQDYQKTLDKAEQRRWQLQNGYMTDKNGVQGTSIGVAQTDITSWKNAVKLNEAIGNVPVRFLAENTETYLKKIEDSSLSDRGKESARAGLMDYVAYYKQAVQEVEGTIETTKDSMEAQEKEIKDQWVAMLPGADGWFKLSDKQQDFFERYVQGLEVDLTDPTAMSLQESDIISRVETLQRILDENKVTIDFEYNSEDFSLTLTSLIDKLGTDQFAELGLKNGIAYIEAIYQGILEAAQNDEDLQIALMSLFGFDGSWEEFSKLGASSFAEQVYGKSYTNRISNMQKFATERAEAEYGREASPQDFEAEYSDWYNWLAKLEGQTADTIVTHYEELVATLTKSGKNITQETLEQAAEDYVKSAQTAQSIIQKGVDRGLDEDEINKYMDYLANKYPQELGQDKARLAETAVDQMLYEESEDTVLNSADTWIEKLQEINDLNSYEGFGYFEGIRESLAGILGMDLDALPETFEVSTKLIKAMQAAANKVPGALEEVKKEMREIQKASIKKGIDNNPIFTNKQKEEAKSNIDDAFEEYEKAVENFQSTDAAKRMESMGVGESFSKTEMKDVDALAQSALNTFIATKQAAGETFTTTEAAAAVQNAMAAENIEYIPDISYQQVGMESTVSLETSGPLAAAGDGKVTVEGKSYIPQITAQGGSGSKGAGSSVKPPSGGGGGGGSKAPTKPKQDPFYNYIKTVDDYKKRLESLQDVQELLTKPVDIFNNTKAQEDYYKTLLGSNQSYLNHVNSELERLQKEAQSKYSKYIEVSIDGSLRLTEEYWASTGDITEELDEWIDAYDDVLGRQKDLTDEINDYKKELKELWEGWRDSFIDLTNDIADVFQELDEKQFEDRQEFYEKLEEQDQRYLESVRNNIEEERKARERANSFEDLQKKQNRLALLQRDSSGRYVNDIAELQEEINSDQQDLADQNVDNILDTLEKQMNKDAERHQDILDAMQKQIDSNVENRIYIERAEQTIAQGEQAILDAIHMGEDWRNASNAEREKMDEEQATNIAGSKSYLEKLNEGITSSSEYISKMVTDALTKQTESLIWTIGDIPQNDEAHVAHAMQTTLPSILEQFFARTNTAQDMADDNKVSGARYASGGLVNYTGPAWVDGTPGKPEAFLNANQTAMIASFTANLAKMISGKFPSSNVEAGSNCEINIDIGSIGADYDIDQAINKVKQEIVNSAQFRNVTLLNRRR